MRHEFVDIGTSEVQPGFVLMLSEGGAGRPPHLFFVDRVDWWQEGGPIGKVFTSVPTATDRAPEEIRAGWGGRFRRILRTLYDGA